MSRTGFFVGPLLVFVPKRRDENETFICRSDHHAVRPVPGAGADRTRPSAAIAAGERLSNSLQQHRRRRADRADNNVPRRRWKKKSVTQGSVRIGGQQINYTATAANYIIKADDGTPKASFFFVGYTKDDAPDKSKRPVSFIFNGGPGSASSYTHMGLGPKRIVLTDDGFGMPAPYSIVENGDSFLDATDMVFVDAISTGYSRPAPGENTAQFYGLEQDATYFADFIYQYLTRNERWASPKFLIGESYGTTRSAQLSYILQRRHQIYLNGVALLSAVGFGDWGGDDRTIFFLPTLVVSAWYHKALPPDLQKLSVAEMAQKARQFAHGDYAAALEKGDELPAAEHQKVVKELARLTGLSPSTSSRPTCASARSAGSKNCCATNA